MPINSDERWKALEGRVVGGKFPLQRWLGGSGHGAVFLTERGASASRQAAVKLIASDPLKAQYQLTLWRTAAQLHHRHLLRIFDMGRTQLDGTLFLYLVMEYADEDLSQILPQRPLSASEAEEMLPPLLDALAYLHQQGFAHGHLKPSNVLADDNQLKLSIDQVVPLAESGGERKRRDVFDAPEVSVGKISRASDVWSLGATLSTVLTQHPPAYEALAEKDLRPADSIQEPFRSIVRDCLRHNPNQRCSLDDIEARLQPPARSVAAVDMAPIITHAGRTGRGVAGALLTLILATVAVVYSCGHHTPAMPIAQIQQTAPPAPTSTTSQPPAAVAEPDSAACEPEKAQPQKNDSPAVDSPAPAKAIPSTDGAVVRQVLPTVSSSASRTITGKVKVSVRVEVDPSGNVSAAKVTSPGPSKYFANIALKTASQWQFSAPSVNGQKTPSAWLLRFTFTRGSANVSPENVAP